MMKFKLAMSALLLATVSPIAMGQGQGLSPDAIPGGDQFEVNCLALIPGGDQFQNAIRQIDDELPEGIPGGDQFDRNAIPGGDQFEPYQIPGGDQFVRSCFEGFQDVGLLIPGGDQFDPQALERLALGEIELVPALSEYGLIMDRSAAQQIANGGGLGFDGFLRPNPSLSNLSDDDLIPGGDQFEPGNLPVDPIKIDDELPEGVVGNSGLSSDTREDVRVAGADLPELPLSLPNPAEGGVVPVPIPAGCDWTGTWGSTYGLLKLVQDGNQVSGDYSTKGFIKGTVGPGCNLKGSFDNRQEQIKGTYEFVREGESFEGLWALDGELPYESWKGRRSSSEIPRLNAEERWTNACLWTGTWFTPSSGVRMRLVQDGARVSGEIGDDLILEGTTDTSCEGNRSVRMQATVTNRETGVDQSLIITMGSGGQRYTGTIGGIENGQPQSNVFSGSRASRNMPTLSRVSRTETSPISDGGGEASRATTIVSATPPTYARWEVSLGKLCVVRGYVGRSGNRTNGARVAGIAWVKARVFDKTTGKEIELAPTNGFRSLNGDKERVWEIKPSDYDETDKNLVVTNDSCLSFNDDGLTHGAPTKLTFEIDYKRYGYASVQELLDRRRNRIRVMYKLDRTLTGLGSLNPNKDIAKNKVVDEFGTKARTHPLAEADLCGTCKIEGWKADPSLRLFGEGLFTQVRDDAGAELFIAYDMKRISDETK